MSTNHGDRPTRWSHQRLGEIVLHVTSGFPVARHSGDGVPTPVANVSDLQEGRLAPVERLRTAELPPGPVTDRCRVESGDILITARGTQYRVAHVGPEAAGAVASSNLILIRPGRHLRGEILLALLQSPWGKDAMLSRSRSSTTSIALSAADVGAIELPVPPDEAQASLAALILAAESQYVSAVTAAEIRRDIARQVVTSRIFHSTRKSPDERS